MGVFLFFILSSFLLTYPFLIKQEKSFERNALINFSYRRFVFTPCCSVSLGRSRIVICAAGVLNRPESGIPFYLTPIEFLKHIFLQQGKGVTWTFRRVSLLLCPSFVGVSICGRISWAFLEIVIVTIGLIGLSHGCCRNLKL